MENIDSFSRLMHTVISNKFELIIQIEKRDHSMYKVIENNNKDNPMAPISPFGDYCNFLNDYVFKYIIDNSKAVLKRFYFDDVLRFLSPGFEYSFSYDFKIKGETLNKRFVYFYLDENTILLLIEDYTKYKLENLENSLRQINNKALIYQVKNDKKCYHLEYASKSLAEFLDCKYDELLNILKKNHPFNFIFEDDLNKMGEILFGNEKENFKYSFLVKLKTKFKTGLYVRLNCTYFSLYKKLYVYVSLDDETELIKSKNLSEIINLIKTKNDELDKVNKTDALTGLGNETKYTQIVAELNKKISEGFTELGIIVCDVNGVKVTNDRYGHHFGCEMIVRAGKNFPHYFKESELFHIGGDEFVIIVLGNDFKNIDEIVSRIRNVLEYQPMTFENVNLHLSVAVGYSKYRLGDTYHSCFQRADDNMYKEKVRIKTEHNIPLR